MKKNRKLVLALAAFVSLGAFAQQSKNLPDGFYRVQNCSSNRYAYICDDEPCSMNLQATDIDLSDIRLYTKDDRNPLTDPASVVYVNKESHKHDICSQNTSFYGLIGHYVQIQDGPETNNKPTYKITPLKAGYSFYALDNGGALKAKNTTSLSNQYYFYFSHFDAHGDEYLGIAPKEEMKVGDKYYKPYIIGFDMRFVSEGMKAYYVSDIKDDAVVLKEITGTIPYNTPVIVECSSTDPSDNRVDLSITKSASPSDNRLLGQYFCLGDHSDGDHKIYDPNTMRVLMVKDGKLVFGTAEKDDDIHTTQIKYLYVDNDTNEQCYDYKQCLQANSSYLSVPADSPKEITVMTEGEYHLSHYSGDVGTIVSMILKKTPANMNADFNGDNAVTIADLALYIDYLKNK